MTIQVFILYFVLAYFAIGVVGSATEKVGIALASPKTIAIGKALEAVATDGPKFVSNLKDIFTGAK